MKIGMLTSLESTVFKLEQLVNVLITTLASIFVASITFFFTKQSGDKKLKEVREETQKAIAAHDKADDKFEERITAVLEKLADQVVKIDKDIAKIDTKIRSYDDIWVKLEDHSERIRAVETLYKKYVNSKVMVSDNGEEKKMHRFI